jgi:REP element-mobilizing transposase RayT
MRPVRWLAPGSVWLVTNRCEQERFLLRPDPQTTNLIGAWLSRALEKYGDGIELYACVVLSNHFHLLLRDNKGQLARFMWYFQTNLAKELNRLRGRTPARVFGRRYHAERVEDEKSFLSRWVYVLCNPVKSGLVRRAASWPGLTSIRSALEGKELEFESLDRTAFHNATRGRKKVRREDFVRRHALRFAVPPMHAHLGTKRRRAVAAELVAAFEREQQALRKAAGKGFLGVAGVLSQDPEGRSAEPSFGPRRWVAAETREREAEVLEAWSWVTKDYRERFAGFRRASLLGKRFHGEWPPWTCPPCCIEPVGYESR